MSTSVKHYLLKAGIPVDLYDILTEYCADLDLTADDRQAIVCRMLHNVGPSTIVINVGEFTSGYLYRDDYIALQAPIAFTKKHEWYQVDAVVYARRMANAHAQLKVMYGEYKSFTRRESMFESAFYACAADMTPEDRFRALSIVDDVFSGKFVWDRGYMGKQKKWG